MYIGVIIIKVIFRSPSLPDKGAGGSLNIILRIIDQSSLYDASVGLYVMKSEKSADFEKMKFKIRLKYSDKLSCFELELSFKCF